MTRGRRAARDLAFQMLFELESRPGRALDDAVTERVAAMEEDAGRGGGVDPLEFASVMVRETLNNRPGIDERIHQAAPAFPLDQMPVSDRVALELGTYELICGGDTPLKVAINEAVELAKRYGGENSGKFVNGVLGTIAAESSVTGG